MPLFYVLESAGPGEGVGLTMEGDSVRQFHESLATRFCEPYSRQMTLVHTANLHLGKAQPSWDLQ